MEYVSCNLCSSDSFTTLFTLRDTLSLTNEIFRLVTCNQCGLVYLNPRPSAEQLDTFYPEEYWWRRGKKTNNVLSKLARNFEEWYRTYLLNTEVRLLKKMLNKGSKILDVGCGRGDILYLCKRSGFETYGIELSEKAARNARIEYGLDVYQGSLFEIDFGPNYFDAITFYHVFEHLPDSLRVLKKANRMLKDEGILVIQIPNIDSLQFKLFSKRWFGLSIPQHFYHFSSRTIEEMLKKANFEIVNIRHISNRCNPSVFVSSLIPKLNPHTFLMEENRGKSQLIFKITYFVLVLLFTPWTLLESACRRGAVITVYARRRG